MWLAAFSGAHVTDVQIASDADIAEIQRLFREYAAWIGVDLSFQDFDRDLVAGVAAP